MSELKRVIEQCDACGRFRYPNDLIAYDCHGCGEWAEKQIIALRAEVAALKAKYTAPLTNDQARMVALMRGESSPAISFYQGVDAAIRAAREGERE